jgi:tetratricopeptide (TPR) repeat protein
VLSLTLLPVLLLAGAEGLLRLFGSGHPAGFVQRSGGRGERIAYSNPFFTWKYFGPVKARESTPFALRLPKPENTCRVFVLGGSAAQGDPDPSFSLARLLTVMLERRYPGVDFEVVNAGITAVNSHVVYEVARTCVGLDSDALVVYSGNNEVVGPYGAGSTIAPLAGNLRLIRLGLAVLRTRLGQLLASTIGRTPAEKDREWGGMEEFLSTQVRHDDPGLETTYRHFRSNLSDVVRLSRGSDTPLVLCTVGVNLRNTAPFASLNHRGLEGDALDEWRRRFSDGVALQEAGRFLDAAETFGTALEIDGEYAELHFRLAQCRWELGDFAAAREAFVRARDLDTLRFRADSRINAIIREVAASAGDGVSLLDVANYFSTLAPDGIPGGEFLYEHVHLSFHGAYVAARALVDELEPALPPWVQERRAAASPLPTDMECAARLVFTGLSQHEIGLQILDRMRRAPFINQPGHEARYAAFEEQIAPLEAFTRPPRLQRVLDHYGRLIEDHPADWMLHYNLASALVRYAKRPDLAEVHYREVTRMVPTFGRGHAFLGDTLLAQGKAEEAAESYRRSLAYHPVTSPLWIGLGAALAQSGEREEACRCYGRAAEVDPGDPLAHRLRGECLLDLDAGEGRIRRRAIEHLRRAVELDPEDAGARRALERAGG